MCGIAGVLCFGSVPASAAAASRMIASLAHRGPDGRGVHAEGPIALGHSRLRIVDPRGGHQPMSRPGVRAWVTFNGEIFNHVELRAELEALGYRFQSSSDTEVLLAAWIAWGDACVHRFNGQWAFAIWDADRQRLFLSRDRLGVRPLYYTRVDGRFLFASEVKALFTDPDVPRRIDPIGLDQAFTFWCAVPPRTVYQGVSELPPGCSLIVERGEIRVERYFDLDYSSVDRERTEADQAEELLATLVDASRLRLLRSDVPVGSYLSGGLDSAVVTGIVRRFSQTPIRTFSVAFEDVEFDESAHQRAVVSYLGVDHSRALCRTSDICRSFPSVVWHAEQPLFRVAPAPMLALSRLARESGYKVVLSGEGADELLGGYDIFKEAKVRRFWARQPGSRQRAKLLRALYPYMPRLQAQSDAYLAAFFHVRPEHLASPFFSHLPRWELTARTKLFYSKSLQEELRGHDPLEELRAALPTAFGSWHWFHQAQYLEARLLLPGYILSSQGDRMAMANGVEGRFPFLDHRVVELASRLPPDRMMRALNEKALLKRAAAAIVPPFLQKRPKQPYRAPDAESFFDPERGQARAGWVSELLTPERLARSGLFEPSAVALLIEKARRGRATSAKDGMALAAIASTEIVVEQMIDRLGKRD